MDKERIKAAVKEKFAEWFDPNNEKYQQRQELIKAHEERQKELEKKIKFYSYSNFGDEVMGNMKAVIIIIFLLCGFLPFVFL